MDTTLHGFASPPPSDQILDPPPKSGTNRICQLSCFLPRSGCGCSSAGVSRSGNTPHHGPRTRARNADQMRRNFSRITAPINSVDGHNQNTRGKTSAADLINQCNGFLWNIVGNGSGVSATAVHLLTSAVRGTAHQEDE